MEAAEVALTLQLVLVRQTAEFELVHYTVEVAEMAWTSQMVLAWQTA